MEETRIKGYQYRGSISIKRKDGSTLEICASYMSNIIKIEYIGGRESLIKELNEELWERFSGYFPDMEEFILNGFFWPIK